MAAAVTSGNRGICEGCGRERAFSLITKTRRLCKSCYDATRPKETCRRCGELCAPYSRSEAGPLCARCRRATRPAETCTDCGKSRPVTARPDGQPVCGSCWRRRKAAPCAVCGRTRIVQSRTPDGPVCGGCVHRAALPGTCSGCGWHGADQAEEAQPVQHLRTQGLSARAVPRLRPYPAGRRPRRTGPAMPLLLAQTTPRALHPMQQGPTCPRQARWPTVLPHLLGDRQTHHGVVRRLRPAARPDHLPPRRPRTLPILPLQSQSSVRSVRHRRQGRTTLAGRPGLSDLCGHRPLHPRHLHQLPPAPAGVPPRRRQTNLSRVRRHPDDLHLHRLRRDGPHPQPWPLPALSRSPTA